MNQSEAATDRGYSDSTLRLYGVDSCGELNFDADVSGILQ